MAKTNNASNVSVGKGVQGGYMFSAPMGTVVPTDWKTPLGEEFANLGYITEDGIEFSYDGDSEDYYDMNGDPYETAEGNQSESVIFTLAETKKDSLAEAYGHKNVSETEDTITVKHNSEVHEERVYVAELLLKNGRRWRSVVPRGKAARSGSTTVSKSNIVGYQITVKCLPDENGNRILDYIETSSTQESYTNMDRNALVKQAESAGISVPKNATKAQVVDLLSEKGAN